MNGRWSQVASLALLLAIPSGTPSAQSTAQAAPYTVLSRDGRRPLATRTIGGQEMFALDDLARLFSLTVREDAAAGGLIVTVQNQTIVLSSGQSLVSVGGRLVALPAAPVREGRLWLVPVDFVSLALGSTSATRLELRKPSRLVLVGDIRVPIVTGRVEPLGSLARLTLDVSPATPHTIVQDTNRLLVRFEADALDGTWPASAAPELIQAVRPGESPTTIAIDLGPRFSTFRASDAAGTRGTVRIIIDVMAQTTDTAPVPPVIAIPTPQAPPPLDIAPAGGLRTIVVDAGHGGSDLGAKGPQGTLEKNVTLAIARRLKAALESRLGARVILTRDGDAAIGLDERAALANNNKADLFVSLHANASVRPATSGAEVFYLSLEEYGDEAQRTAHAPSETLPVFGGGSRDIEVIAWELAQARYIDQSAILAQAVESALRERVPMSPRAIQQAPFRVLVGANMPAVLVEVGFISNPEQEQQLANETFQVALVQALTDAITRFRDVGVAGTAR